MESQVVTLTTAPSAFGLPGLPYSLGVLAQSQSHDPVFDQAVQAVTFAGYHGLEAAWLPGPQTVLAGQPAQFTLVITNTGNLPATVSLALTADAPAEATLPLAALTLPPFGVAVQGVAAHHGLERCR